MDSTSVVVEAPVEQKSKMLTVGGVIVFGNLVMGMALGLAPAIIVMQATGSSPAALTTLMAVALLSLFGSYLLLRGWRFRAEFRPTGLLIGKWFPTELRYDDVRRITVSPTVRGGRKDQSWVAIRMSTGWYRVFVAPTVEDMLAGELLQICPQAVMIDAHQREHFPPRLAAASAAPGVAADPERVRTLAGLQQEALRHHRFYARVFLLGACLTWFAAAMTIALMFDPRSTGVQSRAYSILARVLATGVAGLFTFAWYRSRRRYRQGRDRVARFSSEVAAPGHGDE